MCVYCGGNVKNDVADYIEKIGNYIIVIKNVPCEKCSQCGEEYFSSTVARKIESILNSIQKISSEITVTIIDYAQAA
ncbi:MAG: type II toxin-antitoxin system MqsA family antitoxin [Lachnospiraceae bacterium]|nr:type II toxin-antitoxin system MqsA family antitoxin [Lachnospiraceae bacterium]